MTNIKKLRSTKDNKYIVSFHIPSCFLEFSVDSSSEKDAITKAYNKLLNNAEIIVKESYEIQDVQKTTMDISDISDKLYRFDDNDAISFFEGKLKG